MERDLQRMVEQMQSLARSVAAQFWRQSPSNLDLQELSSVALMGLVSAADQWPDYCQRNDYDPMAHEYFQAYALRRMRGSILDFTRTQDFVTRQVRQWSRQIAEVNPHGTLSDAQVAKKLDLTLEQVARARYDIRNRPESFDAEEFTEVEQSSSLSLEDEAVMQSVREDLGKVFDQLSQPEQVVIALHYWVGVELAQVAEMLGITESRASHLHAGAVLRVRGALISSLT